jgi:hypothetical protein
MPTEKDTPPCANHMPACSGAQLVSFRLIADQVGPLIADDSRNVPGNDLFAGTPGIPSKLARQRQPRSSPAISETSFTTFLLAAGFQDPLKFRDCQTEDRCGGQSMPSISGQFHCPTDGTSTPAFFEPPSCQQADIARRGDALCAPQLAPYGASDCVRPHGTAS